MKRLVEVLMEVEVQTDDSKFTEQFMEEFRKSFFPFFDVKDHAEHIAQLAAREVAEFAPYNPKEFVEGYGPIGEMGISARILSTVMDVVDTYADGESEKGCGT